MTSVFEPFDLEAFKAFVAGKPAGELYDGGCLRSCALGQYGLVEVCSDDMMGVPQDVYEAAVYHGRGIKPRGWSTFGALLDRLNTLTPAPSHE